LLQRDQQGLLGPGINLLTISLQAGDEKWRGLRDIHSFIV
jgi:hypothetical protein